jgi:hypothetical protein
MLVLCIVQQPQNLCFLTRMCDSSPTTTIFFASHVSFNENYYDTKVIGDLYDTRKDEILSTNVQNLETRARLSQNPVAQMTTG